MPTEGAPRHVALVTGADLRQASPGGTRSYVLGLANFLARSGFRVEIVANGRVEEAPSGCIVQSVRSDYTPSTIRFHLDLRRWTKRRKLEGIDLLHFQRPDDFVAFLHLRHLPPAVCTLHGDPRRGVRRRHGRLVAMAYAYLERRAFRRFREIISIDGLTADSYRARYPSMADRISVCPNAVDDEWLIKPAGSRDDTDRREGPPVFLFAGRLSIEKRVDRIMCAIAESHALAGAKLLIAGVGPEEANLRWLADGRNVEFKGPLPRRDLAELYRQADALVLSSEYEGLPTVVLEAIASGCPAVVPSGVGMDTTLGGWPGIVATQPGHLPEALLAAVRLRRNGSLIRIPEEFCWSHVGSRILEVYRRVWRGSAA